MVYYYPPIDPFHGPAFLPRRYATAQPYTYRNIPTFTDDIARLRYQLDKLQEQVDGNSEAANENADAIEKEFEDVYKSLNELKAMIQDVKDIINGFETNDLIYNPTTGRHEDSVKVMDDMYRELAVHGASVDQAATIPVEQLAQHTTLETAAIGDVTIFGGDKPKIKEREGDD